MAESSATSTENLRRSRRSGVITAIACTECRKKRTKCDGRKPCGRCRSLKGVGCVYEVPRRDSKNDLRKQIDELKQRQRCRDQIFAALGRENLREEVSKQLRQGRPIEGISEWLGGLAASHSDHDADRGIVLTPTNCDVPRAEFFHNTSDTAAQNPDWRNETWRSKERYSSPRNPTTLTESNPHAKAPTQPEDRRKRPQTRAATRAEKSQTDHQSGFLQRYHGLDYILSASDKPGLKHSGETWTTVVNDVNLVQHLLALYFCWEYPTFASFSKQHFLRDFWGGRHRYCSPLLVNVLLALGCRFSNHPMVRADAQDPGSVGDQFFQESLRLYSQETDRHSLTTIQALVIMSIREASCGRDFESSHYARQAIRLAFEKGLHHTRDEGDKDDLVVKLATFWGAYSLDHMWSLTTGSLPQCSRFPQLPSKPVPLPDIETTQWSPYSDEGAPLQQSCAQQSNVLSVYKCFCELSELIHLSLYFQHSPGNPMTARGLLRTYTKYLNWYDSIPEVIRLGHNFTPAVLFIHMYYHFAVLLLFRPLIKLRIIGSKLSPQDICLQAANAIQGFFSTYSKLYTLKRTPSFMPYFLLTSSVMHLAIFFTSKQTSSLGSPASSNAELLEAVKQGIAGLEKMAPCHTFAQQSLRILAYLAQRWDINIEIKSDATTDPEEHCRPVNPSTSSISFFAPHMGTSNFLFDWITDQEVDLRGASDSLENWLFWPFPLQQRSTPWNGQNLEEAGFAVL